MDFIYEYNMHVLNVPSETYTYSGPAGESDIDVSLGNDEWVNYTCKVKSDWCISDHNAIVLDVMLEEGGLQWTECLWDWVEEKKECRLG